MTATRLRRIDCTRAPCPQPLTNTIAAVGGMKEGDLVEVRVRSPAAQEDIERWARKLKHDVVENRREGESIVILLRKGVSPAAGNPR